MKTYKANTQNAKILKLLKESQWVCVTDMLKLYIVDYRRRLVDLKERGHELESRRCTQHKHSSALKEWHLKVKVPQFRYEFDPTINAVRQIPIG